MNSFSTFIAIIVALILMVIVPSYRAYFIIDQQVLNFVNKENQDFVNNIRHKGFISKEMYEKFILDLSKTQNVYGIEIIHTKKVYYPLFPSDAEYSIDTTFKVLEQKYSKEQIIEQIYAPLNLTKDYRMSQGDTISIKVENKSITGYMVYMSLMGANGSSFIFSRYGGMITNEDY